MNVVKSQKSTNGINLGFFFYCSSSFTVCTHLYLRNYPSHEAWEEDFKRLDGLLEPILACKGKIHEGPQVLAQIYKLNVELQKKIHILDVHAMVATFQDLTNDYSKGMYSRITDKANEINSQLLWIDPEILSLPNEKLEDYKKYEDLKPFERQFEETVRYKAHTLSAPEEAIYSAASSALSTPYMGFLHLNDADLVFEDIKDANGNNVPLTNGSYSSHIRSECPEERKLAFEHLFDAFIAHKNTITTLYFGAIKGEIFSQKTHHYPSCLERSLFSDNVPVSVYNSLIKTVHKHLPTFHKYLSIRQKALKLDTMNVYDLYVPFTPMPAEDIPYEKGCEWILEALAPLGEEYVTIAREAILGDRRWVDVYENKGKRTNACSIQNVGETQYLMLCYDNTFDALFTLAHELGHSMHHFYSSKTQPFQTAFPPIFTAEVASTTNEALLFHYLMNKAQKENNLPLRKYLLNLRCDDFRATLIRQTQFAEFEKGVHEMAEKGEAITPSSVSSLYKRINDIYYGDACLREYKEPTEIDVSTLKHNFRADNRIAYEYLRIPHFYTQFYVYKYSTSMSVAEAVASKIVKGDKEALDKYLNFLKVCENYTIIIFSFSLPIHYYSLCVLFLSPFFSFSLFC